MNEIYEYENIGKTVIKLIENESKINDIFIKDILNKKSKNNEILFNLSSKTRSNYEFFIFYLNQDIINKKIISTENELTDLSYQFSTLVCDDENNGLISLFEINNYLLKYSNSPFEAINNILTELLPINYPILPEMIPINKPNDWLYEWLKTSDLNEKGEEIADKYYDNFIKQNIINKEDLLLCTSLNEGTLMQIFQISVYGDRNRIMNIYKKLMSENTPNNNNS
jgi:hypothetical protein